MVDLAAGPDTLAPRRFTVEEYHLMAKTGILAPTEHIEHVELVRGVVRRMSPKNRAHVLATHHAHELFRDALRGRASVYMEAPLRLPGLDSEPEPDVQMIASPLLTH